MVRTLQELYDYNNTNLSGNKNGGFIRIYYKTKVTIKFLLLNGLHPEDRSHVVHRSLTLSLQPLLSFGPGDHGPLPNKVQVEMGVATAVALKNVLRS